MKIKTETDINSIPEIISFIRKKDYKGIKKLGSGSFGVTVLLEDETINEKFVCKKYLPQNGIDKEKVGLVAGKIRDLRPVEPYHMYGIRK